MTAEQILLTLLSDLKEDSKAEYLSNNPEELQYYSKSYIEFAKFHVEAALKAASGKVRETQIDESGRSISLCTKDSILNAYPLSNIK